MSVFFAGTSAVWSVSYQYQYGNDLSSSEHELLPGCLAECLALKQCVGIARSGTTCIYKDASPTTVISEGPETNGWASFGAIGYQLEQGDHA